MSSVESFLSGKTKLRKNIGEGMAIMYFLGNALPPESPCVKDSQKCEETFKSKEMDKLKKSIDKKTFDDFVKSLKIDNT